MQVIIEHEMVTSDWTAIEGDDGHTFEVRTISTHDRRHMRFESR